MKFHIVTPCLEPGEALYRTVASVQCQTILQSAEHSICHVIQLPAGVAYVQTPLYSDAGRLQTILHEEKDAGIYDALARGFANADADVFCYLGAGDLLAPYAMELVAGVMRNGTDWLTGMICGYNPLGHLIEAQIPFRYRSRLIRNGAYGRCLPYIQQESTFWSRRLHALLDWTPIRSQRLAGDALMWYQMSRHSELTVVEAWLGGFEKREGQASADISAYRAEVENFCDPATLADLLVAAGDWLVWHAPRSIKRKFSPPRYVWNPRLGNYTLHR